MIPELEPTSPVTEPTAKTEKAAESGSAAHGTVERCEFEELLERAMEILKARRASA